MAARLGYGLTQADVAALVDVDQATVSRWEAGYQAISIAMLCRLAVALNVEMVWLLGEDLASGRRGREE